MMKVWDYIQEKEWARYLAATLLVGMLWFILWIWFKIFNAHGLVLAIIVFCVLWLIHRVAATIKDYDKAMRDDGLLDMLKREDCMIVPIEPSLEMRKAGNIERHNGQTATAIYQAMLATASYNFPRWARREWKVSKETMDHMDAIARHEQENGGKS